MICMNSIPTAGLVGNTNLGSWTKAFIERLSPCKLPRRSRSSYAILLLAKKESWRVCKQESNILVFSNRDFLGKPTTTYKLPQKAAAHANSPGKLLFVSIMKHADPQFYHLSVDKDDSQGTGLFWNNLR